MHQTICAFILDCLQNSFESAAEEIQLEIIEDSKKFTCSIIDNGCGMDEVQLKKAFNPFYSDGKKHVSRKVGLGIPFLVQAIEQIEGTIHLDSEKGKGTKLEFSFNKEHFDAPPVGNLVTTLTAAFTFPGDFNLSVYRICRTENLTDEYMVSKNELKQILGDLNVSSNISLLRQYLESQEENCCFEESAQYVFEKRS